MEILVVDANTMMHEVTNATNVEISLIHLSYKIDRATPVLRQCYASVTGDNPQIPRFSREMVRHQVKKEHGHRLGISVTISWLQMVVEGHSITSEIKWRTPVPSPGYEKKVLYVWIDAYIGYHSITANYTRDGEL